MNNIFYYLKMITFYHTTLYEIIPLELLLFTRQFRLAYEKQAASRLLTLL
jgi:hypothetical protein